MIDAIHNSYTRRMIAVGSRHAPQWLNDIRRVEACIANHLESIRANSTYEQYLCTERQTAPLMFFTIMIDINKQPMFPPRFMPMQPPNERDNQPRYHWEIGKRPHEVDPPPNPDDEEPKE